MNFPVTRIETVAIEPGRRILATSDIHGYDSYFEKILAKAGFDSNDILFIVGDMIEKGPNSLATLRRVMELCEQGNVIALIGNVDATRMKIINELCEENVDGFYRYCLSLRAWNGSSFFDELAEECGYKIESAADILRAKQDVIAHFEPEFNFLASLPTVVETQNYVFVHGGLRERAVADNRDKGLFELTKYDDFMTQTPHVFDKYVVVGHWPVALYNGAIQQQNPIINREKKIISLDGGCGVEKVCQLNLLVIPDINAPIDAVSFMSYDDIPTVRALDAQEASAESVHIYWTNRAITLLERGDERSYIEHNSSGRKLYVPNSYLKSDTECYPYTSYELPVQPGDHLSLISESPHGCVVKKDGVIGWYHGAFETDESR